MIILIIELYPPFDQDIFNQDFPGFRNLQILGQVFSFNQFKNLFTNMWNSKIDNFIHFECRTVCLGLYVKTRNDATFPQTMAGKNVTNLDIRNSAKTSIKMPICHYWDF